MIDFSFKRLLQLIRKQWIENARLYLYSFLALIGLLGIAFIFWIKVGGPTYSEDSLVILFLFGIFITGTIFASTAFSMLGSKDKGTYWLSVPASHAEKLICVLFYNVIVFTIIYCLSFYLMERLTLSYVNTLISDNQGKYSFRRGNWEDADGIGLVLRYFLYVFFAVQALYLLGSAYFKRFAFILTTVVGAIFIFSMLYYCGKLSTILPDYSNFRGANINIHINNTNEYKMYAINPIIGHILIFLFQFIWAPFFWCVTWFKLKEKEI